METPAGGRTYLLKRACCPQVQETPDQLETDWWMQTPTYLPTHPSEESPWTDQASFEPLL